MVDQVGRIPCGPVSAPDQRQHHPVEIVACAGESPCRRQRQVPEQLAAGQQKAVEHAHPGFEHIADLRRLRLDVGVEDRPADDVECEVGHRHVDVELHAVSPANRRALRGRHHLGAVRLDHGPAEHRLDHPPPAQVVGALAGEQPVTEQAPRRPQRAALHKRGMLVDKDAADQVRIADEMEAVAARKRHLRDRPACPGNTLQIRQRVAQIGGGVAPTGRRAATNALRLGCHSHAGSLRPARSPLGGRERAVLGRSSEAVRLGRYVAAGKAAPRWDDLPLGPLTGSAASTGRGRAWRQPRRCGSG